MSSTDKTLLCRYHYDPLDCLVNCTPSAQARTQRFYLKERLSSEIQGSVQRSIFQQEDQLLAQQQRQDDAVETTLLATDLQRSVLHALDATQPHPLAYTPYGHRPAENGLLSLLGFNGERPDPVTGHYLLGNGYRAFNPVLMRFNSPDSLSPFGEGGLNAYVYCVGDPVNREDSTGHIGNPIKGLLNIFGRTPRRVRAERAFATAQREVSELARQATQSPPYPTVNPYPSSRQPPGYTQSPPQQELAPAYTRDVNPAPLGGGASSTSDLLPASPAPPPPPYVRDAAKTRQNIDFKIEKRRARRDRIKEALNRSPNKNIPIQIQKELVYINADIRRLKQRRLEF
ncbi:RHS repeat-associated core domain-containing protein [Pseudomonas sp. OA65]|uniref:RHS repeat-associated core domain-containing protein n=1 Tax=Pseudomonas sp. OA65 TaxID=2818431 RepID=UPI001FB0C4D3|nr:RHS repeat-associated core domain-containing protein [Pseudomonas sp. OA65]